MSAILFGNCNCCGVEASQWIGLRVNFAGAGLSSELANAKLQEVLATIKTMPLSNQGVNYPGPFADVGTALNASFFTPYLGDFANQYTSTFTDVVYHAIGVVNPPVGYPSRTPFISISVVRRNYQFKSATAFCVKSVTSISTASLSQEDLPPEFSTGTAVSKELLAEFVFDPVLWLGTRGKKAQTLELWKAGQEGIPSGCNFAP